MISGVSESEIIEIALDDDINEVFRNPSEISDYVRKKCADKNKKFYVLLDEIQLAISKEELKDKDKPVKLYSVLNGLLKLKNIDIYVTGSNSKLLSKDVLTEFRGRGDVGVVEIIEKTDAGKCSKKHWKLTLLQEKALINIIFSLH